MGPLEAILHTLKEYDSLQFDFDVDTDTGDVVVKRYSSDGLKVESESLVRLSTVEVVNVGV